MYSEVPDAKNVLFEYENDKTIWLQFDKKSNIWELFPCSVLAPESERLELLLDAAEFILKKQKAKKFTIEIPEDLRKEILGQQAFHSTLNQIKKCYGNLI